MATNNSAYVGHTAITKLDINFGRDAALMYHTATRTTIKLPNFIITVYSSAFVEDQSLPHQDKNMVMALHYTITTSHHSKTYIS